MAKSNFVICKHRGVEYVFASMSISSSSLGLEKLETTNSSWTPKKSYHPKMSFPTSQ